MAAENKSHAAEHRCVAADTAVYHTEGHRQGARPPPGRLGQEVVSGHAGYV